MGKASKRISKKYDGKMWPLNFNIERRHNHYQTKEFIMNKGCEWMLTTIYQP